ncbi:MAG TPA: threonine ammonia-lyase [Streptosporangiaceae bacterium]|nr:threonine ammonia-lyase [Streptosporangiaceae bacterium]
MTATPLQVGPGDVLAAREALRPMIRQTPLLESNALSALVGGPAYLKCENLQRAGSFKVRGAYLRIARLTEAERARGVVAASAGNHAQGVALAAAALGTHATVVMPAAAPLPKVAATRSYGAEVILHGAAVEDALAMARELAEQTGSIFIHPFEHPDVIAGQGTVGLEIAEQCPHARTVVVPVGGGGLAAGVAVALSAELPRARLIGVQAEAVAPVPASIAAGHPVSVTPSATMADGIAVATPGVLATSLLATLGARAVTVTEENLSRALLLCLERAKQLVEPAGAAGVAAILEHPAQLFEPPVVVILSGGNIDPLLLSKVLRHGLSAAGRYLAFRCRLPDRPGALATLLSELAVLGANVLDVMHERVTADLRVDEAEVNLHLETRGPEHCESVITQLRKAGYTLLFS